MKERSYFDHAASSPLRPAARDVMLEAMERVGNPSSVHREGREARRILEDARRVLADCLAVQPSQLIFTSGATEANAAVLSQARQASLASAVEHPSILAQPIHDTISVSSDGEVDFADLEDKLKNRNVDLVSIMAVNNETGVMQPFEAIAEITHAYGARLHVDAVQALGRLDVRQLSADFITLSAHKIGGPKGVGAIIVPDGTEWQTWLLGGGQEQRRRSGTENIAGAAGFAAALSAIGVTENAETNELRLSFERQVREQIETAEIVAHQSSRASHICSLTLPGRLAETVIMQLDLAGIAISAGSACSSGKVQPSHVLKAMGFSDQDAETTIRISFGWTNKAADVLRLLNALNSVRSNRA